MKSIFNYKLEDLIDYFESIGEKPFKARQLFDWIYRKRIYDLDKMSNISINLREKLKNDFSFDLLKLRRKQTSELTNKYLFELADGNLIEAVLMRHDYGNSVCVSSQVGCNMGCAFCESGRLKKVRDLEASEIVRQILMIEEDIKTRISSVVVMGIGEPFDNYDNIMNFIRIINDPLGIAIGARHITVSTSGLVPMIKRFGEEDLQINLAISLHAPNNEIRDKIMKINKAYKIEELIQAIRDYIVKTNRRVTIEYVMLNNVNDSIKEAKELASLLSGMNVYVNLIPYNETSHIEFKKSSKDTILAFYDCLKKCGINVTIRKEFGGAIDAACGQLRASEVEKMKSFYITDSGRVRSHNEDSVTIVKNATSEHLMIVADGMGGHRAGEVASSMVVTQIGARFQALSTIGTKLDAVSWLKENINEINTNILKYSEEHPEAMGLGTTCVMALLTKEFLMFVNIGDSSGFVFKKGKLQKITKDHTLVNFLVETGDLSESEAINHPKKNVLMKALGAADKCELDIFDVDPNVDAIMLCSDGLTNMLTKDQIERVLNEEGLSIEDKLIKLIKKCNVRGGQDNISIAFLVKESGEQL